MNINDIKAELDTKTTVELRVIGKELGIKGASKGRGADLRAQIIEIRSAEIAAAEAAAKPVKPAAKNRCQSCGVRPISKDEEVLGHLLCLPCFEFGTHENTHSDYNHGDDIADLKLEDTNYADQDSLDKYIAMVQKDMESCWVCRPELDRSADTYVGRKGTSRAGMRMTVPVRASGREKAETVIEKVTSKTAASTEVKVIKGVTTLIIDFMNTTIKLVWRENGSYNYPASSITEAGKPRKVRNVSSALATLGL